MSASSRIVPTSRRPNAPWRKRLPPTSDLDTSSSGRRYPQPGSTSGGDSKTVPAGIGSSTMSSGASPHQTAVERSLSVIQLGRVAYALTTPTPLLTSIATPPANLAQFKLNAWVVQIDRARPSAETATPRTLTLTPDRPLAPSAWFSVGAPRQ